MRRPLVRMSFVLFGATGLVAMLTGTALAYDQTPPALVVPIRPTFVVGTRIEPADFQPDDQGEYEAGIHQRIAWTATDASGVCSFDLFVLPAGSEPEPIFEFSDRTEFTDLTSDYDGDFGGGSFVTTGFSVTAHDCAGNATTKVVHSRVGVTQEDGRTEYEEAPGTVAYSGTWGVANCACFMWGHTAKTTQQWANVRFTRVFDEGDHVGLVMALGPARGKARVLIDGVRVATVDTFALTNENRTIVWEHRMTAGTHTVRVTNLATPGRSRIDVDGFVYSVP